MPKGVYVYEVDENGPAAIAGVKVNDIIVKFAGKSIANFDELDTEKNKHKSGESITIEVYRDWSTNNYANGEYVTITFVLSELKS